MKRIIRDRRLTPEEVAKYDDIRRKVEQEFPPLKPKLALAEVYITRVGDMSSYDEHDDLDGAIEHLKEMGVKGPVFERLGYGFTARGYEGANYISFYVGKAGKVDMERSLKAGEVRQVIKAFQ